MTITPKKIKKNRCYNCKKKYGLFPYDCKCGHKYCSKCRYTTEHKCTYDHFKEHTKKLKQEMPIIESSKLIKI